MYIYIYIEIDRLTMSSFLSLVSPDAVPIAILCPQGPADVFVAAFCTYGRSTEAALPQQDTGGG